MTFQVRRVTNDASKKRRFSWKVLPFLISVLHPLSRWYRSWKTEREEETKRTRRVIILKRILLVLIAVLCALLLLIGTVKALFGVRILSMRSVVSMTGAELPKDEHGFTNILLLGVGDKNHEGIDLTDTLIVASIDPKTQSVVLLSLPRDLYFLRTENMGKGRINSLYRDYKIALKRKGIEEEEASQGAMRELAKEIGNNLDLTIHHVVKVDFTAFVKAVDAIGGIDVTVPYDIVDTEYPKGEQDAFETFSIKAGPAHLDGETALKYVRSRHTTSDFDRSARQQQLIKALGEKVKKEAQFRKSSTIIDMYRIFSDHVEMTMSIRELIGLAELAEDLSQDRVISVQLNDRNGLFTSGVEPGGFLYTPPRDQFDGASVLLPVSIPEFPVTWKQIQLFSSLLFDQRNLYLEHPSIAVLNAGAKSGLAGKIGGELMRFGWSVDSIENAFSDRKQSVPASFVAPLTEKDKPLAQFFADLLKLPLGTLPASVSPENARQVTIVLGKEYTYKPLQDLLPAK